MKLVEKLKAMTGTRPWGGTYPQPIMVERIFRVPQNVTHFPYLCVIEGSGSTAGIQVTTGGMVGLMHTFKVLICGYVIADAGVTRSTWLQRLWADLLETLVKSSTLDGIVQNIDIDPNLDTDEGDLEPIGAFVQGLTVVFHESLVTD